MKKHLKWITVGVLLLGFWNVLSARPSKKNPIKILMITGAAPYGYHTWKSNMEVIEPRLKAFDLSNIEYHVAQGLEDWRKWEGDYNNYDAIIIIYYWSQAPNEELEKLDHYVRSGGALVIAHSALAGFWEQKIFDHWTGVAYRERDADYGHNLAFNKEGQRIVRSPGEGDGSGHAPIDTFRVKTKNTDHPIMQGLPTSWMQSSDELYYGLRGPNTNLNVLAVAKAPDGTYAPQAWVRQHREGRIFCLTLGHHKPGVSSVGFITLLARGIEWTATGTVRSQVPLNFPGEDTPVTAFPQFDIQKNE